MMSPIDAMSQAAATMLTELEAKHDKRVAELLAANTREVEKRREVQAALTLAMFQIREYERLFDLQWKRTMEADEFWRKENPRKEFTLPDLGDLLNWLMKKAGLKQ